jgi:anti-sigma B factor antagonist
LAITWHEAGFRKDLHAPAKEEHDQVRGEEMKIHTRTVRDVHILDIDGQIVLGQETKVIRNTIKDLLHNGVRNMVLNLAEVNYIDSSGVGELVSSFTTVAKEGGQLKLLNLTTKVREILAITRLLTIFQVYDNEEAAVSAAFNGNRVAPHLFELHVAAPAGEAQKMRE